MSQSTELLEARVISRVYRLKREDGSCELQRVYGQGGKPLMFDSGLRVQVGEETAYTFEGQTFLVRLCWVRNEEGSISATGHYIRSSALEIIERKAA